MIATHRQIILSYPCPSVRICGKIASRKFILRTSGLSSQVVGVAGCLWGSRPRSPAVSGATEPEGALAGFDSASLFKYDRNTLNPARFIARRRGHEHLPWATMCCGSITPAETNHRRLATAAAPFRTSYELTATFRFRRRSSYAPEAPAGAGRTKFGMKVTPASL